MWAVCLRRITRALLVLAASWLGPASCYAQGDTIVYGKLTNPHPQDPPPGWDDSGYPIFSSMSGTLVLDFNGDGQPDAGFADNDMSFYIFGYGSTRVLTYPPAGLDINSFLPVLSEGTEIGAVPPTASLVWRETVTLPSGPYSATYNYSVNAAYGGLWQSVEGYTGIEFYISGQTHYAWIHVGTPFTGANGGYIREYAYETRPDTPILAGAVPEPSTCGLLGIGMGVILMRYFRRSL